MSIPITPGEWITSEEQLARWLDGKPVHRQFKLKLVDKDGVTVVGERDMDECTPDFSCCRPNLLVDLEIRVAFVSAPQHLRNKFLGTFLRAMLADVHADEKVTVAGGTPV